MRKRVSEKELATFKKMRNMGATIRQISDATGFGVNTVRKYLEDCPRKSALTENEKYSIVKNLLADGQPYGSIANYIGESVDDIAAFVSANGLYDYNTPANLLTVDTLNKYRDSLHKNQKVKVRIRTEIRTADCRVLYETKTARILNVYPYIAQTDLGCFSYFDLYKANLNNTELQSTSY